MADALKILQERYNKLTATSSELKLSTAGLVIDIASIDVAINSIKSQIESLKSVRNEEQDPAITMFILASTELEKNYNLIVNTICANATLACESSSEFNLPMFINSLTSVIRKPGFITIGPKTSNSMVSIEFDENMLGSPSELNEMVAEARAIVGYGGVVAMATASLLWALAYMAAREGKTLTSWRAYKKKKTYRNATIIDWDTGKVKKGLHGSDIILGDTVEVVDEKKTIRFRNFYKKVIDAREIASRGKAPFWLILEHGTISPLGVRSRGGKPYPKVNPTRFLSASKKQIEEFLTLKITENYAGILAKNSGMSDKEIDEQIERLSNMEFELIKLKLDYTNFNLGIKNNDHNYKAKFKGSVDAVLQSINEQTSAFFGESDIKNTIAKLRLEGTLLLAITGKYDKINMRPSLGSNNGKVFRKRLTSITKGLQKELPLEQDKLIMLLKQIESRLKVIQKELEKLDLKSLASRRSIIR